MPFLIDSRFEEVASFVQSDNRVAANITGDFYRYASRFGYKDQIREVGPGAALELLALDKGIEQGFLSASEAEAFLTTKYPDYQWAGGVWGDQGPDQSEQKSTERQNRVGNRLDEQGIEEPEITRLEESQRVKQESGTAPSFGPLDESAIQIDSLPEAYDSDEIQQGLDTAMLRVNARLGSLRNGNIEYQPHTIPGEAMVPGSVSFASLDPKAVREALNGFPGPEDAITLRVAPVGGTDTWIESSGVKGPGRVWRVTSAQLPADFAPGPGPIRYRVISPGMRFPVCATEITADPVAAPTEVGIHYGFVLAGIPSFGQQFGQIIGSQWVGDGPTSYATEETTAEGDWNDTPTIFEDQPRAAFETVQRAFMEPLGNDAFLSPSLSDALVARGFLFGLIKGRTAQEVFQELCTRSTLTGARWVTDGALEGVSVPRGTTVRPMTSAQVVNSQTGTNTLDVHVEGDDLSGLTTVVEGVPFLYRDCRKLVATQSTFSMMVMVDLDRTVSIGTSDTFANPAAWHQFGLKTVQEQGREWQVDVIVQ